MLPGTEGLRKLHPTPIPTKIAVTVSSSFSNYTLDWPLILCYPTNVGRRLFNRSLQE